ncbi:MULTISPECIES: hypothetical protein [unclassified Synechocystis]|uniref:hypothetical protein n=1 Tax=unclassified Synechocystis TaxID=2640012 RepID=UPI0004D0BDA5|nr:MULTISPECIES: hypothetical protein [unclassified Synechocystis]AIE73166.1 hypothetical protein D082_06370 [Synechocystis sp. PCC 6714]
MGYHSTNQLTKKAVIFSSPGHVCHIVARFSIGLPNGDRQFFSQQKQNMQGPAWQYVRCRT